MRLHNIDGHTMASIAYNEDKPGIPIIFIHGLKWDIENNVKMGYTVSKNAPINRLLSHPNPEQ